MLATKTGMDMPYSPNPGELVYAGRLDKMFQELQSGHPPVFWLAYCCYGASYDLCKL